MRVFLAGRFSRRDEFSGYADELRSLGITVDARWLEPDCHGVTDDEVMIELADMKDEDEDAPVAALIAVEAFEDLRNADVVVAFTEPPKVHQQQGRSPRGVWYGPSVGEMDIGGRPTRECLPRDG